MKKILFTLFIIIFLCTVVYANELVFTPAGGGKFIYCNNPEGISDDMLLDGEEPRWIMNNDNLLTDNYYIYLSHFNYTSGFDIQLDMQIKAVSDTTITIHKAFFETPETYAYMVDGTKRLAETDWGQLNVCSSMLGVPMCDIRGDDFYYPATFEPVTLELKQGEATWLSYYLNNYKPVHFGKGVHVQALIEVKSGAANFNVGALKENTREYLPENINYGEYRWDYTLKGISDSLPEVKTNLCYTIDNNTTDGTKIPVFLKNQYIPEGHTVTEWYTQLNPQNDIWSKSLAAESDILTLRYKDDAKLNFYGSNVAETQKDNIWQFDTLHSAARKYEQRFNTGTAQDFVPNFVLDISADNHTYACNIGNYGIATTYCMSVTNKTDETKYCTLAITAASEIIAHEKGTPYAYVKDLTGEKVTDNMLSHEIPPNTTENFEFSIILPVNYNGGIKNEFIITEKNIQAVDFEKKRAAAIDKNYTDACYGTSVNEIRPLLPKETSLKLQGGYEYLKGKDEAIARWCAWDGAPDWYYNIWSHVSTVYTLDKNYNIIGSYTFPSLPCEASYNNGYYYIKTARDGVYKSKDGTEWIKAEEKMPVYIPYYDLENASQWAISELEKAWNIGLRLKWHGESYNFTHPISRENFCELADSLLNTLEITSNLKVNLEFDDTTNPIIGRLASLGIINGFGDGTFRPDAQLTREQAAVILSRITKLISGNIKEYDTHSYNDDNLISEWAKDGVNTMYHLGIMQGTGNNMFSPQDSYSGEQSAVTLFRLYENSAKVNII